MVHLYFGNGKGKTTAAMGLAVRCAGREGKVLICQFLKNSDSGELNIFRMLPQVQVMETTGKCKFLSQMTKEEKEEYRRCQREHFLVMQQRVEQWQPELVVLDELVTAFDKGMLSHEEVLRFLDAQRDVRELVITGHVLPQELAQRADYITEMKKHRHPYDLGVPAREGIER
ncbi:MAG: cob(I)yrinic acid a,c-diamide adenosyltransferase [Eubacteriales bacterium]